MVSPILYWHAKKVIYVNSTKATVMSRLKSLEVRHNSKTT